MALENKLKILSGMIFFIYLIFASRGDKIGSTRATSTNEPLTTVSNLLFQTFLGKS